LRRVLAGLDTSQSSALLEALRTGQSTGRFHVYATAPEPGRLLLLAEVLVWRRLGASQSQESVRVFDTALQAASAAYAGRVFGLVRASAGAADEAARKTAAKRLRRLVQKLEKEERRLLVMSGLGARGEAIKARLYAVDPNAKLATFTVWDDAGREIELELDPSLSLRANMDKYFRLAAKGKRGLPLVAERRVAVQTELDAVLAGRMPEARGWRGPGAAAAPGARGAKRQDLAVRRFRTSDGFLVLRGRNSAANHAMLSRHARPYDLWFHVADGPGCHCILKRDFPDQQVPEQSLREAAVLTGLRSWQAQGAKAEVHCALVKDVRKVKGGELGRVRVENIQHTLLVALDPGLEMRLGGD